MYFNIDMMTLIFMSFMIFSSTKIHNSMLFSLPSLMLLFAYFQTYFIFTLYFCCFFSSNYHILQEFLQPIPFAYFCVSQNLFTIALFNHFIIRIYIIFLLFICFYFYFEFMSTFTVAFMFIYY